MMILYTLHGCKEAWSQDGEKAQWKLKKKKGLFTFSFFT